MYKGLDFEVKKFNEIGENSRIFRNFHDYSNQDFFTAVRNLQPTACGEHKLYWFRFNLYAVIFGGSNQKTGSKNTG